MAQLYSAYSFLDVNSVLGYAQRTNNGDLLLQFLRNPDAFPKQNAVEPDPNNSYEYLLSFLQIGVNSRRLSLDKFWIDSEYIFKYVSPSMIGTGYIFPREEIIDKDLSQSYVIESYSYRSVLAFFSNFNSSPLSESIKDAKFEDVPSGSSTVKLPHPETFEKMIEKFESICKKELDTKSKEILAKKPELDGVYCDALVETYAEFLRFVYGESTKIVDSALHYIPTAFIVVRE